LRVKAKRLNAAEGRNPGNMREQENLRIPDRVRDDDDEDFIDDPLKV